MAEGLIPQHYSAVLTTIKQRIRAGQSEALRAVNTALIQLYWDIGQLIAERQAAASWSRAVVEQLAADLQAEFPGIQGFSARHLWYMRTFYRTYADTVKLQPLVAEIGWSHNLVILDRCSDDLQREFYLGMTRRMGEFLLEYVGKMQFYLAALDDVVREEDEHPSIGIILCKSKDKTTVEYALRESNKPIGVTTCRIVSTLPREIEGQLPAPDQIVRLREGL